MGILGKDPDVNMMVYHLGFHPIGCWGLGRLGEAFLEPVIESMTDAIKTHQKPVLLALRPPQDLAGMKEFLFAQNAFVKAGLPVFYSLSRLARAVIRVIKSRNP